MFWTAREALSPPRGKVPQDGAGMQEESPCPLRLLLISYKFKALQIVVVQRPGRGTIEDLPIRLVEDEIDGVGASRWPSVTARQDLATRGG